MNADERRLLRKQNPLAIHLSPSAMQLEAEPRRRGGRGGKEKPHRQGRQGRKGNLLKNPEPKAAETTPREVLDAQLGLLTISAHNPLPITHSGCKRASLITGSKVLILAPARGQELEEPLGQDVGADDADGERGRGDRPHQPSLAQPREKHGDHRGAHRA